MTVIILTLLLHLAEIRECTGPDVRWTLLRGCLRNDEQVYGFNPKPSDVPVA